MLATTLASWGEWLGDTGLQPVAYTRARVHNRRADWMTGRFVGSGTHTGSPCIRRDHSPLTTNQAGLGGGGCAP
jgi:hypothetical protein